MCEKSLGKYYWTDSRKKTEKKELRTSAKWLDLSVFNVHGRLSSSKVYDEKLSFPYLDGVWLKQHSDNDF